MAQAAVTQTTLDIRGVPLVVRQAGDGPPLLYLHDELSTGWNPFLDLLAERFHVVAPEIPGFGDTALPDWVETIADVAFLVTDVADVVGSGAPIAVVGASLGGWLALEAGLRGAAFSRVAAIGSPGAYIPGDPPTDYFFMTPEERLALLFNDPSGVPEINEDHSVRNQAMTARLVWQPRYVSPKLEHRIHRITSPTLVAWGSDDRFLSQAHGQALVDYLLAGSLTVVPNAGHFAALDQPDATAKIILDFLS
ncbi:MAG: alpha/beta hydrolase [Chloroflexi bacterium]|nr:alpha/beta hydrolase [Chloroflexota bacterium]MDA1174612.1 alpha/beta hydrolase [Chloroflexota bacterium]